MFCIKCGKQLESDSQFCVSCGAKAVPDNLPTDDSKPVAGQTKKTQAPPAASSGATIFGMQRKLVLIFGGVIAVLLAVIIGLIIFIAREPSNRPRSVHVDRVASGFINNRTNMTVGDAFEQVFNDFVWTYSSDDDNNYVSFHGNMQRDGETIAVQFIFQFLGNDTDFEVLVLSINGTAQNTTVINELLDYIFASARR